MSMVASNGMLVKYNSTLKLLCKSYCLVYNNHFCLQKKVFKSELVNCQASQQRY